MGFQRAGRNVQAGADIGVMALPGQHGRDAGLLAGSARAGGKAVRSLPDSGPPAEAGRPPVPPASPAPLSRSGSRARTRPAGAGWGGSGGGRRGLPESHLLQQEDVSGTGKQNGDGQQGEKVVDRGAVGKAGADGGQGVCAQQQAEKQRGPAEADQPDAVAPAARVEPGGRVKQRGVAVDAQQGIGEVQAVRERAGDSRCSSGQAV